MLLMDHLLCSAVIWHAVEQKECLHSEIKTK